MRAYRRNYATQVDINKAVAKIASQLAGLALTVKPNGVGHRIQCDVCGWSECYGTVTTAREHAVSH